jgi:hypothetical protein
MTTDQLHHHLLTLRAERAAASLEHLDRPGPYIDDLRTEVRELPRPAEPARGTSGR